MKKQLGQTQSNLSSTVQADVKPLQKAKLTSDSLGKKFNPSSPELQLYWGSGAPIVCCINAYPNGVTFSVHKNTVQDRDSLGPQKRSDARHPFTTAHFSLRFKDTREYQSPAGKYFLFREDCIARLEEKLAALKQRGLLGEAVIYFGTTSDPFLSFHRKFDVTTRCLELLERFVPARLVVQTRSPMIISALPTLRLLHEKAVVVVPIETHVEKNIARYTPGQPRIAERLVAAEGLRRQGISVCLSAAPILPYGDYYRDAWDFAELLDRHADYISVSCLASGSQNDERQLRTMAVARKLSSDREFRLLRPHAYKYLFHALKVLAPQKLLLPLKEAKDTRSQLDLFAA